MPLRILEAQSCGLPIIGSNISGINDVVINNKTGYLINSLNIYNYIYAILYYYKMWKSSSEDYYEYNKYIRNYIIKNYDWKLTINRIEDMFKKIYYY